MENCFRLQKSFPEIEINEPPFPKSVYLHKNWEWILLGGWTTLEVL